MPALSPLAVASTSAPTRVEPGRRASRASPSVASSSLGHERVHAEKSAPGLGSLALSRGRLSRGCALVTRASAADAPPAIAPAHLRTTITPVPPEIAAAGGMLLADQPGMKAGFGDLTAHDFLRVDVDAPNLRVLCIDPPILTVDDFLTPDECVTYASERPGQALIHFPLCGGTPPELGWQSLELYASRVLPPQERGSSSRSGIAVVDLIRSIAKLELTSLSSATWISRL